MPGHPAHRKLHARNGCEARIARGRGLASGWVYNGAMKLITAIIKPFKLDEVRKVIADLGVSGITVTEVLGFGRQRGHTELYRGAEYTIEYVPKARIEIAVSDDIVEPVIEAIISVTRTGKVGDGKLFVQDLCEVTRIRTSETGNSAL